MDPLQLGKHLDDLKILHVCVCVYVCANSASSRTCGAEKDLAGPGAGIAHAEPQYRILQGQR